MKKRIGGALLAFALAACLGGAAAPQARAAGETLRFTAARTGGELVVTAQIEQASFNVAQFYVSYDKSRLRPAGGTAESMTEYLQKPYDEFFSPDGWMDRRAKLDAEAGQIGYVLNAAPAAADKPGSPVDAQGYVTADGAGLPLVRMRFAVTEGATLYQDSVRLGVSASAPTGLVLATKGSDTGVTDASAAVFELGDAASPGMTPGGWSNAPAEETPDEPQQGGQGGQSGGQSPQGGAPQTGGKDAPQDTQPKPSARFADISQSWAKDSIEALAARGVLTGYALPGGGYEFRPSAGVTRGEFAAILCRALPLAEQPGEGRFADMRGHWAAGAVNAAFAAGYVAGTGDAMFEPDAAITREQMVTILARVKKLTGGADAARFTDDGAVSAWAREAVYAARAAGIATGYEDGSFRPASAVTREEAAALAARVF